MDQSQVSKKPKPGRRTLFLVYPLFHAGKTRPLSALRRDALSHLQLLPPPSLLGKCEGEGLFGAALEWMRKRYRFVVAGYVVMPEHVHLLVNEPQLLSLDRAVKGIKLSVALRSRQRPFWQPRYYDFNVWTEEKRIEKLRYMHRNPVKRGLVPTPEAWAWSSFRHYATGLEGTVEIESQWAASLRGQQLPAHLRFSDRPGPAL